MPALRRNSSPPAGWNDEQASAVQESLYDATTGGEGIAAAVRAGERLYGRSVPLARRRPYVIANFVACLDGVVSLGIPAKREADRSAATTRTTG